MVRLLEMFGNDYSRIKNYISSYSITDEETMATISHVYKNHNYTLDPHGAVAYASLEKYLSGSSSSGFFLETAHPLKFSNVVETATGKPILFPDSMKHLLNLEKKSVLIEAKYEALKSYLSN